MIVYYLGIPGSGKSYSGVNAIYNNFSDAKDAKKDLKKSYVNCYTNINEFKFDLVHDVYKFDFDVFLVQITELHSMYVKKATDEELIIKAKEFKIYKTLFILDECHQYLDVDKKVLVWWLTYHRHLYHDIYLITQNLSLVGSKYKPLAEAFFKAKPMSLTLNKSYFNYIYYTDKGLTQGSKVNVVKVKKRDSVFKLYQSGDSVASKNVILRFIYIAIFFLCVLFLFGYMYLNSKKIEDKSHPAPKREIQHNNKSKVISHSNNKEKINYANNKLFMLSCTISNCSNDDIEIPPQLLAIFIQEKSVKLLYKDKQPSHLSDFYLSSSNDFYNFVKNKSQNKEKLNNEQNNNGIDLFGNHKSSK